MKKSVLLVAGLTMLMGCAQPGNAVLKPYQLADGRVYQDVVSIGADGRGAAPTVTMVSTYALGHAKKNGRIATCRKCSHNPVVSASASQTGVWNILIAGAAAKAVSTSGTTINNTNTQSQTQDQSQSSGAVP